MFKRSKGYFENQTLALRICGISLKEYENPVYKILSKILLFVVCAYPLLSIGDLLKHDFDTVADMLIYEFSITLGFGGYLKLSTLLSFGLYCVDILVKLTAGKDRPIACLPLQAFALDLNNNLAQTSRANASKDRQATGCVKSITVLLKRAKIAKVLNKLEGNLNLKNFINGDEENEQLVKQCITIISVQTSIYWVNSFLCYIFAVLYTLVVRIRNDDYHKWQFPYGPFTVLNVTYSPNYEISWAYQSMVAGIITIQFSTIDLLQAAVLCHICFHLKILQNNLYKMVENSKKKMENVNKLGKPGNTTIETLDWKYLHDSLKKQIEYHSAIIDTTKEVDESFSTLLSLVFLGTLGMLSFLAYKASLIPLGDVRMIRTFAELSVIVIQVLMICFWSDVMVSEGKEVGYAAYKAHFVGTDLRFQKSLVLIMRRSQNPIRLTAGFVNISLTTFTWILRSTYSYYMILRKQYLNDDG